MSASKTALKINAVKPEIHQWLDVGRTAITVHPKTCGSNVLPAVRVLAIIGKYRVVDQGTRHDAETADPYPETAICRGWKMVPKQGLDTIES
jgi:hypothetical protein